MRVTRTGLVFALFAVPVLAQDRPDGPTDEKAQKTYKHALELLHDHRPDYALEAFKKADKQDGGHCQAWQKQMLKYGSELGEWKTTELGTEEMVANAPPGKETAIAHFQSAVVFMREGLQKHKYKYFTRTHEEATKALTAYPSFPDAMFLDGRALAHPKQDDRAKARFEQFVKLRPASDPERQRASRFVSRPELARARMAPPFSVTTTSGQQISMDGLQGKVVLLDFWATRCGPCREALPHIRNVAKKFQGHPLVILSVSLDSDEQKWRDFINKNEMTWPQYYDVDSRGQSPRCSV